MVKTNRLAPEKKPRSVPAQQKPVTRSGKRALSVIQLPGDSRPAGAQQGGPTTGLRSRQGAPAARAASAAPAGKQGAAKRQHDDQDIEHDAEKENKKPRKQEPLRSRAQQPRSPPPAQKPPSVPQVQQPPYAPASPKDLERDAEARLSGVGASAGVGTHHAAQTLTAEGFQPWNRDHIALVHSALLGSNSAEEPNCAGSSTSTSTWSSGSSIRGGTVSSSGSNSLSSSAKPEREMGEPSSRSSGGGCSSKCGGLSGCAEGAPLGREQQFTKLHKLLAQCCTEGIGRSVYISGLPGTGKSHTVRAVLDALKKQQGAQQLCTVFLSCFSLKDPSDVHRALHAACKQSLTGAAGPPLPAPTSPQHAHQQLTALLQASGAQQAAGRGAAKRKAGSSMYVLVLDEVDRLLLKGTEDLYKLFMLPQTAGVRCCVVALANSIDITERSLPALKCRGCMPEFMPFTAYSRPQVLSILSAKLAALPWPVFQEHALELAARKVSSSTGDLRKVLQACRFALTSLHDRALAAVQQDDHRCLQGEADRGCSCSNLGAPQGGPHAAAEQPNAQGTNTDEGMRTAAGMMVGVADMASALARLNYQAGSAASLVSTIRGLPQQQQLHLLALATAVATSATQAAADAEAEAAAQQHGLTVGAYRTKYYWGPAMLGPKQVKSSNPFAVDAQRSAVRQGSSGAPGAAVAAGRSGAQISMRSTAGQRPAAPRGATQAGMQAAAQGGPSQDAHASAGSSGSGQGASTTDQAASTAAAAAGKRAGSAASGSGSGTSGGSALCAGDAARMVPLARAYEQFRRLAVQMFQQPISEQEFRSTMQLLSHTGLVGVDAASAPLLSRAAGSGSGGGAGKAKEGGAALSLKVQMKDIQMALRDNVLFKRVLSGLPAV